MSYLICLKTCKYVKTEFYSGNCVFHFFPDSLDLCCSITSCFEGFGIGAMH